MKPVHIVQFREEECILYQNILNLQSVGSRGGYLHYQMFIGLYDQFVHYRLWYHAWCNYPSLDSQACHKSVICFPKAFSLNIPSQKPEIFMTVYGVCSLISIENVLAYLMAYILLGAGMCCYARIRMLTMGKMHYVYCYSCTQRRVIGLIWLPSILGIRLNLKNNLDLWQQRAQTPDG